MKEKTLKCGQHARENMNNKNAYTYNQKENEIPGHNAVLGNLTLREYKRNKNEFK